MQHRPPAPSPQPSPVSRKREPVFPSPTKWAREGPVAQQRQGEGEGARQAFAAALERQNAGDIEGALALYRRTIEFDPGFGDAYNNLAILLNTQGKELASVACLRRAVALGPASMVLYANLGNYLRRIGRYEEATAALDRALEMAPEQPEVLYRYALLLDEIGQSERAIDLLDRAIAARPDDVEMLWTRACVQLRVGDFERGLAGYEIRFRRKETALGCFTMPMWAGESVADQTILVHTEQGFGDTVQLVRLLPMLAARGARVWFSCPPEMMRLMAGFPGIDRLLVHGATMPGHVDYHVPLLSLPYRLGLTLESIPTAVPYLTPPAGVSGPPVPRPPGTKLAVGIAWAGNPKQANDANRSMPLEHFFALSDLPGVALYSLQKGARAGDLAALGFDSFVHDLGPRLSDFADTAAAMMRLDLIVSICSAPAHLAGALGRPTFVPLTLRPHWLWMREREHTPWYPTLRLFRQEKRGDWAGVMLRVRAAVEAMCRERS